MLSASGHCLAHRVEHLYVLSFLRNSSPAEADYVACRQRRLSGNDASIETWRLLEQYQAHDLVRVYPAPGEIMQGASAAIPDEVSMWRDNLGKLRAGVFEVSCTREESLYGFLLSARSLSGNRFVLHDSVF